MLSVYLPWLTPSLPYMWWHRSKCCKFDQSQLKRVSSAQYGALDCGQSAWNRRNRCTVQSLALSPTLASQRYTNLISPAKPSSCKSQSHPLVEGRNHPSSPHRQVTLPLLYSALYSTLLLIHSTLLYSTLLYSTLLYSTLLYSTQLCSTLATQSTSCNSTLHSTTSSLLYFEHTACYFPVLAASASALHCRECTSNLSFDDCDQRSFQAKCMRGETQCASFFAFKPGTPWRMAGRSCLSKSGLELFQRGCEAGRLQCKVLPCDGYSCNVHKNI